MQKNCRVIVLLKNQIFIEYEKPVMRINILSTAFTLVKSYHSVRFKTYLLFGSITRANRFPKELKTMVASVRETYNLPEKQQLEINAHGLFNE